MYFCFGHAHDNVRWATSGIWLMIRASTHSTFFKLRPTTSSAKYRISSVPPRTTTSSQVLSVLVDRESGALDSFSQSEACDPCNILRNNKQLCWLGSDLTNVFRGAEWPILTYLHAGSQILSSDLRIIASLLDKGQIRVVVDRAFSLYGTIGRSCIGPDCEDS